jgi:LPS sulfotransferase NodH
MSLKHTISDTLRRTTGYTVVRARPDAPELVDAAHRHLTKPVFILSSVRSGSTLLRSIMGAHSELHAPHELHLRDLKVDLSTRYVEDAMRELGYSKRELEYMLWDCLLARQVAAAGKKRLVNKTPHDVFMWRRITTCWPDVRFVYLQRHPVSIMRSWHKARPRYTEDEAIDSVLKYLDAVEEARTEWAGHTVRYEDLTVEPEKVTRGVCEYLGVEFEQGMLDYAKNTSAESFRAGLGDWSKKIKSGKIQAAEPLPDASEIPPRLKDICEAWDYV